MSPRAVGRHATRAGGLEADPATVPLLPLKPGEWTVLGLLGGGTMYGFGLLKATAPDGELGRVWSVPMPVVYRSTSSLRASGLIEPVGEERSDAGPPRTLLGITPAGRQQLLLRPSTPGAHIARGARARTAACEPRSPRAARGTGDPVHATGCWTGARAAVPGEGFEQTLACRRFESAQGVMRFWPAPKTWQRDNQVRPQDAGRHPVRY